MPNEHIQRERNFKAMHRVSNHPENTMTRTLLASSENKLRIGQTLIGIDSRTRFLSLSLYFYLFLSICREKVERGGERVRAQKKSISISATGI